MRYLWLGFMLLACGKRPPPGPTDGLTHITGLANNHVPSCVDSSMCGSGDEPPPGGPHCPNPLPCRVWGDPQNRCEYIHNLEHGHMVMAYNCPSGCPDVVTALTSYWGTLPSPHRALVTPDPLLKTKVAAMVWGWTWAGDAVDTAKLDELHMLQDSDAPEPGLECAP